MIIKRYMLAGAGLLALSACTPNDIGLGNAAKANYAAQTVVPDPTYEEAMVADGNQTAGAQERYRKGTVKKVKSIRTTNSSSGGGGGGQSGSGSN